MLRKTLIGLAALIYFLLSTNTLVGQQEVLFYSNNFENEAGWIKSFDVIDQYGCWYVQDGVLIYEGQEPAKASLHVGVDISDLNLSSDKILVSVKSGLVKNGPDQHWGIGLRRSEDSEPILFLISANNRWGLYKGFGKKSLLEGRIRYDGVLNETTMEIKLSKSKSKFDFTVRDADGNIIVQQNIVEYYDLRNSDALDAFIYAESGEDSKITSIWFDNFNIGQK